MTEVVPIPEPPGYPVIGHIAEINSEFPLGSFLSLADKYGEIYRLRLPGRTFVVCNTHALIDELCDEKRFKKVPSGALYEVRNGVHDGLFTAKLEEPNWGIAHRVLMPAFGPISIRGMFDEMHDIASQLVMKWARYGPQQSIMVTDDFTRLTLDTLALCAMGYRFNSYYQNELHPFVEAMGDFLTESGSRIRRPLPAFWYRQQDAKYAADIDILRNTASTVLKERLAEPENKRKDLLAAMLAGKDPKTNQRMTDESIIDNLITFLIAGHETTSGMLSFTMYQLLKHPEKLRKAQQEVDDVVGKGTVTVEHMGKLPYINAVLRETLRICSPISQFVVQPIEDTLLGGKYPVAAGEPCNLMLAKAHMDPAAYGEDADEFKPERMLDGAFEKLPKNAWKPFGNGLRGCIGRPFAWQEALLIMAMILQNFNFVMDDPNYNLAYKQTLTVKPKGFYLRAILRDDLTPTQLEHRLNGTSPTPKERAANDNKAQAAPAGAGLPLTILYGSNSGTCEAMAQRLASDASQHGFKASTLDCMDAANGNLPKDQPVVIITASYEGQPPDNAAHFVSWIESIKDNAALKGVSYAVFGCGHHDWSQTFHRIPKLMDTKLEEAGATRLAKIGLSDAANNDMFADFESWEDDVLWPTLTARFGDKDSLGTKSVISGTSLQVSVTTPRSSTLRQDVQEAEVVATRVLTAEGEPVKKHMEIKLPSDTSYRAGDYLAVLPINPRATVARAMRRFALPWDACLDIRGDGMAAALPINTIMPAADVFAAYVELSQPATRRNLVAMVEATNDDGDKAALRRLAEGDAYAEEISAKRTSVLDLLERFPSARLPLATFLAMLPPMRVRQYSISSSPLWNPQHVTLTFSLLRAPATSSSASTTTDQDQRLHLGVASSYLHGLEVGDRLHVAVRPSHAAFHLPADPASTPVIFVAAGTGIAPFRGFVQERAAMLAAGRKDLADAVLYVGCRAHGRDDLYEEELRKWEAEGAVVVRRALSRADSGEVGEGDVAGYVQDALWADRDRARALWRQGAKLYVCGSRRVGDAVKGVMERIRREWAEAEGKEEALSEEEMEAWWEGVRNVRFATDVFD